MVDQERIAERLNELADGLEADCPLLELAHDCRGRAHTVRLLLDLDGCEVALSIRHPDDNGIPSRQWSGVVRAYLLNPLALGLDEAEALLRDPDLAAALWRVCDEAEVFWDGNNRVGRATLDAEEAVRAVIARHEEAAEPCDVWEECGE